MKIQVKGLKEAVELLNTYRSANVYSRTQNEMIKFNIDKDSMRNILHELSNSLGDEQKYITSAIEWIESVLEDLNSKK